PSGAGFEITGKWTDQINGNGNNVTHTFIASGDMAVETALGEIPFTVSDAKPLTITTKPAALLPDFGEVDTINWDGSSTTILNTDDPASPLNRFSDTFGLHLSTPQVQWGVNLGSNLSDLNAPLNNAIPYIYFSLDHDYSAQFGVFKADTSNSNPLTVAF